jgi:uncharacterized membrane protein YphA (DoxX/SURF4 family)
MRIIALIARLLLGLIFLVFGLNGFLSFLHMPPLTGLALQYLTVMSQSGIMNVVFLLQVLCAVLLLAGWFVPLALTLIAPVIVNIFLFHATMAPSGLPLAFIVVILWIILFWRYRASFAPLFANTRSNHG